MTSSTFMKLINICFLKVVGFQSVSIKIDLNIKKDKETPESLQMIALRKYIEEALKCKTTRISMVELLSNESISEDELKFLENYPALFKAAKQGIAIQNENARAVGVFTILVSGLSTRTPSSDGLPTNVNISFGFTRAEDLLEEPNQPSTSNHDVVRDIQPNRRAEVETAVGRRQPQKKRNRGQQNPNGFTNNSPKSFYNYKNNTKFHHCRF